MAYPALVTEFKELRNDERALFRKIFDFHGIDVALPEGQFAGRTTATHFRSGRVDEWMEVFDAAQRDAASAQVPAALKERFDWPK